MKLFVHKAEVPIIVQKFPAGESLIRIVDDQPITERDSVKAMISFQFKSNDDLIDLLLLTDAVRRYYFPRVVELSLTMDYLPYARQDRVCNPGESLSVKVIANLINSQGYARVICKDLHSDVSAALINNLINVDMNTLAWSLGKLSHTILVSPDAGANKKVLNFAKKHGFADVVRADKTRNTATGEILGTKVFSEHVGDHNFLILDDMCDGGRTFIELAKELRKLTTGQIYLYVTHGLFTKGADIFNGVIDRIYTSNLMGQPHPLITEI